MTIVSNFRKEIIGADPFDIVDRLLLGANPIHVTSSNINLIHTVLSNSYNISSSDIRVIITGSASLGFSIVEKRRKNEPNLPRYRLFSPESDIDVAVISAPIFDIVWRELSAYSHRAIRFPHDSGRLGDYLVCGWLRPDHFPRNVRLRPCDDWSDAFHTLSRDARFHRRKVRGGLFNSIEHLRQYMKRGVSECIQQEENP